MKRIDLIRQIEQNGCVFVRHGGRHDWYQNPRTGASQRARTLGLSDGLTKLVLDAETERVLGVAMAGQGAGEMIAEGVLAVEMGAVAKDLALTLHAHPTLSETMMEAAEAATGHSTHFIGRKP